MTRDEQTVREQIIHATIECIELGGIQSLTTRGIACAAGVNIASVNYYFRSKEKLVEEALALTLHNFQTDILEFMKQPGKSPKEVMRLILLYYLEGGLKYPGITKAHLYDPIFRNDYQNQFIRLFGPLVRELVGLIRGEASTAGQRPNIVLAQMISAVMLPVLMPRFFAEEMGIDFSIPDHRTTYINDLLDRFL